MAETTILWYDYETFGINSALDQAAQIGAVRTDTELQVVGDPLQLFCRPTTDRLPSPMAVMVTGITPQHALEVGVPEPEFAAHIESEMLVPGTVTSGYNTLRFDDDFTRHLFFRNLLPPYAREWGEGRGRWDIIDLTRAMRALRPGDLQWPVDDDGNAVNKLDQLTVANDIEHGDAHDAVADVMATIEFAKLLKSSQPKLYEYYWGLRNKAAVVDILKNAREQQLPLVHTTGKYHGRFCNTSAAWVLGESQQYSNQWALYDLRHNPEPFIDMSDDELATHVYPDSDDVERLPVKMVHANKSPFLAPLATLNDAAQARTKMDMSQISSHASSLRKNPDFIKRLIAVMSRPYDSSKEQDVEATLYGGDFWSKSDQQLLQQIRGANPGQKTIIASRANDERIPKLVRRLRARHFRETLSESEQKAWDEFRVQRLLAGENYHRPYSVFAEEMKQAAELHQNTKNADYILTELKLYAESIYPEAH